MHLHRRKTQCPTPPLPPLQFYEASKEMSIEFEVDGPYKVDSFCFTPVLQI